MYHSFALLLLQGQPQSYRFLREMVSFHFQFLQIGELNCCFYAQIFLLQVLHLFAQAHDDSPKSNVGWPAPSRHSGGRRLHLRTIASALLQSLVFLL